MATGTVVQITTGRLRLDHSSGLSYESARRAADLSAATSATLTFDYQAGGWASDVVAGEEWSDERIERTLESDCAISLAAADSTRLDG